MCGIQNVGNVSGSTNYDRTQANDDVNYYLTYSKEELLSIAE